MFKIGFAEIFLFIVIFFLIAPMEIPKVVRKIGELLGTFKKMRKEWKVFEKNEDIKNIQQDLKEMQREFQEKQQQGELEFQEQLAPIVEQVAKDNGIGLIFRATPGLTFVLDPNLDITPLVIQALNKPSEGQSNPGASGSPQSK